MREVVLRPRTFELLGNTILLAAAVLSLASVVAIPTAWLTTRTDLKGAKLFVVLGTLPLAIPGYVLAMCWLGFCGDYGVAERWFGIGLWRPSGFWGATCDLALYTFPYLFLNLRASMARLDPALAEVGRAHGLKGGRLLARVLFPQLRPAYLAGSLLVVLHVFADFGVVALMRFETLSFAIYTQYNAAFDRTYAAWLALLLVATTGLLLWVDARLLRGRGAEPVPTSGIRASRPAALGRWRIPSYTLLGLVAMLGVAMPVAILFFWLFQPAQTDVGTPIFEALGNSLALGTSTAVLAILIAAPLVFGSVRRPGRLTRFLERTPYLGYSIPPLAFALALVFASLQLWPGLYQTLPILVYALTFHFLAEAVGPLRAAVYRAPKQLEEAARAFGLRFWGVLSRVTIPLLWRGAVASIALVFLAVV
ncbi:MAG: iron ABC transporter permease, partial [Planctomycetota bacterium]|nr:iron ABC transporter permease [Planctomycetota bacterium]